MEITAKYRHAQESAQKVRLVANLIRGMSVVRALDVLTYSTQKAASFVKKTLCSAVSNAENNDGLDRDDLIVSKIWVDESFRLKRMHARAKGRGSRIIKRFSHITIVLSDMKRK